MYKSSKKKKEEQLQEKSTNNIQLKLKTLEVEKNTRVKSIASLESQEAELLQRIRET